MQVRVNTVVNDSIVDGPGLRMAVFLQGCPHACAGCHNPQTHDPAGGTLQDVADILEAFDQNPLLTGVTLTGGEPLLQPEACLALTRHVQIRGKTVWVYTGYTLEELRKMQNPAVSALLHHIDVLVDGRFMQERKTLSLLYRGSANQRVIDMKRTGQGAIVLWRNPWAQEFTCEHPE